MPLRGASFPAPAVRMVLRVDDPHGGGGQESMEALEGGPSRPPLGEKWPVGWRLGAALLGFVLGVAVGGGAVLWRQARPEPAALWPDEHAVELVLFQAVHPESNPSGRGREVSPLEVDGALLLSGLVTSTVLDIGVPGDRLNVRVPALPATVSPTSRFQAVTLEVSVQDCRAATQWTPGDRPFTITWRDESGRVHMDRAGDFGGSMATSFTRYIEVACDNHAAEHATPSDSASEASNGR